MHMCKLENKIARAIMERGQLSVYNLQALSVNFKSNGLLLPLLK
jgi:hypothetical protein